jgi:hypothetical protein
MTVIEITHAVLAAKRDHRRHRKQRLGIEAAIRSGKSVQNIARESETLASVRLRFANLSRILRFEEGVPKR